jgi:hypothetical protein
MAQISALTTPQVRGCRVSGASCSPRLCKASLGQCVMGQDVATSGIDRRGLGPETTNLHQFPGICCSSVYKVDKAEAGAGTPKHDL